MVLEKATSDKSQKNGGKPFEYILYMLAHFRYQQFLIYFPRMGNQSLEIFMSLVTWNKII